jgi:glutamate synthase domain-containing protein 3
MELDKIIKLKEIGTSWLKIQHETGINRRTAKRAYEKWKHSQPPEILKEARKDVAAKAFLDHLKSLTTLAGSVVTNLSVPRSITDMNKNAEQFFAWLWQQNLLWRGVYMSPETQERYNLSQINVYTMGDPQCFLMGDPQFNNLENELLFKCLRDHTRGEGVQWEETLEEWKRARDNCAKVVPKLQKETSMVVNNFLNQERETDFLQRVKKESRLDDPAKQMANVILEEIWRAIPQYRLDEEGPWFQIVSRGKGSPQDIDIIVKSKRSDEKMLTFIGSTNKSLAEKVTHVCNLAANNLCKGEKSDMVKLLQDEVRTMKDVTEKLREMLNPVKLTPVILRTRCDLCPA